MGQGQTLHRTTLHRDVEPGKTAFPVYFLGRTNRNLSLNSAVEGVGMLTQRKKSIGFILRKKNCLLGISVGIMISLAFFIMFVS